MELDPVEQAALEAQEQARLRKSPWTDHLQCDGSTIDTGHGC